VKPALQRSVFVWRKKGRNKMKKILLSVLCMILLVGLVIPAAGSAVAQVNETLYLSDSASSGDGTSILFEVELDAGTGRANLTPLPDVGFGVGIIPFNQVDALACTPDGTRLFAIDKFTSGLGYYNVEVETWTGVGVIPGVTGIVLAAFSPGGALYIASEDAESLYTVDTGTAAATLVGVIKRDGTDTVNLVGADIIFSAGGTLYLWTNNSATNAPAGLYILALPPAGGIVTATYLGSDGLHFFTGLAIRDSGAGDLVGSTAGDLIFVVSKADGSVGVSYAMYLGGSPYDYTFGDMTVGALAGQGEPGIQIIKNASRTTISPGDLVTYTYNVTNTGEVDLSNITVIDDQGLVPVYVGGDDGDGILNPGETWVYEATANPTQDVTNIATACGTDETGVVVCDDDPATVTVLREGEATRTQGFWKTHCDYTGHVFEVHLGGYIDLGWKQLDSSEDVFGMLWANTARESDGSRRGRLCRARVLASHQAVAAILNHGLHNGAPLPVSLADIATILGGTDIGDIMALKTTLDNYNNSGDDIDIVDADGQVVLPAHPKCSLALAHIPIADC
jgi:uncharacterized repeat protein (TIGR01451 family)